MISIRQLTALSLLAASTQAHSLVNTQLFARQSSSDGAETCLNAITTACVSDETTCKNAICGTSCTSSVPALSSCCSKNYEDLDDLTDCLQDAVGDLLTASATASATGASSTTASGTVVATHASSSGTVAGGATTTSHPTGVVVTTSSTHSGTSSTSTTGTASTKGINVTTASGTPTPTGNAASGMGVAHAGVIGSALVWAAGLLVI